LNGLSRYAIGLLAAYGPGSEFCAKLSKLSGPMQGGVELGGVFAGVAKTGGSGPSFANVMHRPVGRPTKHTSDQLERLAASKAVLGW